MTKNMGAADRVIRILLALAIAVLYFTGKISGTLAFVLGVFAIVFILTSLVGWCPAYFPLGLSTRKSPTGASMAQEQERPS
jgi:hypothetical protein